ncbi:MAG: hypothetical protein ABI600_11810 [Luteolibacter sp.]
MKALILWIAFLSSLHAATTISASNISLQGAHIDSLNVKRDVGSGILVAGNNSAVVTPALFNGIFVFDISAIPDAQFITSAQLTMRHSNDFGTEPAGSLRVDLYLVGFGSSSSVYPSEAIFKNDDIDQPTGDGVRLADNWFDWSTVGQSKTLASAGLVAGLNTRPGNGNPTTSNDFVFFRMNTDSPASTTFRNSLGFSNLAASPGNFPTLSVTYDVVPEPSALMISLVTVGMLVVRRRSA